MKYSVWDSISYGFGEPLTPFTKLYESENLNDIINFIDEDNNNVIMFICENNKILFDTSKKIYESPNKFEVYERNILSNKKKLIKK